MPHFSAPHVDLTFMSPMSQQRADGLAGFLAGDGEGTVVDIGCGWAELLLLTLDQTRHRSPGLRGLGIDLDEEGLTQARRRATERGLADRVTLLSGDGRELAPESATAVVCIGASQVFRGTDDDDRLPYRSALSALRALVPRGGRVVYGDGIWTVPPSPAAIAPLGNRLDEFVDLATLVDLAVEVGFMPVGVGEASLAEWDAFESGYGARYARWLAEHDTTDPEAGEVHKIARRQREGYLRGYRGVLGLAYLQLVAV